MGCSTRTKSRPQSLTILSGYAAIERLHRYRAAAPLRERMPEPATLLVDCRCTLGEGIVWWPERRCLLWTDIEGRRLWMHRIDDNVTRQWPLPDRLGSFAICESGRLLFGLAKQLAFADLENRDGVELRIEHVIAVDPDFPHNRINDGRTDRAGNFVFGTMNELQDTAAGSFYQVLDAPRASPARRRRRHHSEQHLLQPERKDDLLLRFAGGTHPPGRLRR